MSKFKASKGWLGAVLIALLLGLIGTLGASSASAVETTTTTTPAPEPLVNINTVTEETYSPDGKTLLGTKTYDQSTEGKELGSTFPVVVQNGKTGSGGSSSASGCRKVTVNNIERTLAGFTAYWYHTWTSWCWTRSTQTVHDTSVGWSISDVSGAYFWRGETHRELLFYDYSTNDGHPRSAYKHYRQGQFDNCVPQFGCILSFYPTNTLRSYYNGTWAWETN